MNPFTRLYHAIKLRLWTHALIRINGMSYVDCMVAQAFAQARELGQQEMLVSVLPALGRQWDG